MRRSSSTPRRRRTVPTCIATLPDNTTYSVAGDHGGIQRAAQEIPIVFAGAGLSDKDVKAPVRSVDIMPTILKAMGITPTAAMDGVAYPLPLGEVALAGRLPKGARLGLAGT
jgi:arylsulfatase A-like enzyme